MTQKIMEWIAEADQKRTECADSEMEYWRGVRDGLQRVLNAIPEPTEDDCDCDERSWYGSLHDSDCPLAGKPRQEDDFLNRPGFEAESAEVAL